MQQIWYDFDKYLIHNIFKTFVLRKCILFISWMNDFQLKSLWIFPVDAPRIFDHLTRGSSCQSVFICFQPVVFFVRFLVAFCGQSKKKVISSRNCCQLLLTFKIESLASISVFTQAKIFSFAGRATFYLPPHQIDRHAFSTTHASFDRNIIFIFTDQHKTVRT